MTSIRQQFGAMVKSYSIAAVRSYKILLTVLSLAAFGSGRDICNVQALIGWCIHGEPERR